MIFSPKYSVIIPVLNEGAGLGDFLAQPALASPDIELIVVDGGSQDGTLEILRAKVSGRFQLVESEKGRARQMNVGARVAKAPVLVFLHADTYLPSDTWDRLSEFECSSKVWGRFNVQLDSHRFPYSMISWFINWRSRLSGIATGDQAIFTTKQHFAWIDGFPDQPLMEDIEFSVRSKAVSRPFCITSAVITSSRKWQKEGPYRTIWLMWRLRAAYAMGAKPDDLVTQYYRS